MYTSNRELESSPEGSGLGLGLSFSSFTASRHDAELDLYEEVRIHREFEVYRVIY